MNAYKTHTDDTLRETVVHGNQAYPFAYYPENIWEFDFHRIDWHWHHELEFLLVDKGMAICLSLIHIWIDFWRCFQNAYSR